MMPRLYATQQAYSLKIGYFAAAPSQSRRMNPTGPSGGSASATRPEKSAEGTPAGHSLAGFIAATAAKYRAKSIWFHATRMFAKILNSSLPRAWE
jgi:hypothetical protein